MQDDLTSFFSEAPSSLQEEFTWDMRQNYQLPTDFNLQFQSDIRCAFLPTLGHCLNKKYQDVLLQRDHYVQIATYLYPIVCIL